MTRLTGLLGICAALASLQALAQSPAGAFVGTWTGTSTCVGNRPACKNEAVAYRFVPITGNPGHLRLLGDKIVDGKRLPMGALEFEPTRPGTMESEFKVAQTHGIWSFTVSGDSMTGTLVILPERAVARDVKVRRVKDAELPPAPARMDYEVEVVNDVDGNAYRVLTVGSTRWLRDNLRVTRTAAGAALDTSLPDGKASNVAGFGRLYSWAAARQACPAGWRLPSDEEWSVLERAQAASALEAAPAGYSSGGEFDSRFGTHAVFWTATPQDTGLAWSRVIETRAPAVMRRATQHVNYGFSVRCIANAPGRAG